MQRVHFYSRVAIASVDADVGAHANLSRRCRFRIVWWREREMMLGVNLAEFGCNKDGWAQIEAISGDNNGGVRGFLMRRRTRPWADHFITRLVKQIITPSAYHSHASLDKF